MHPLIQRMDKILERVIERQEISNGLEHSMFCVIAHDHFPHRLPDDTLLLMFGDHGMTDSGDHGGATDEETISGLFVYSRQNLVVTSGASSAVTQDGTQMMEDSIHRKLWNTESKRFEWQTNQNMTDSARLVSQVSTIVV
jgi:hypothetical protein